MGSKTKKQAEPQPPTEEEIAEAKREQQARNLDEFVKAGEITKRAFQTKTPTLDMVRSVSALIISGIDEGTVEPFVTEALHVAKRFGANEEQTLEFIELLSEDSEGEEHLAAAKLKANEMGLAEADSCDVVLGVYYEIYGVDEPPFELGME